MNNNYFDYLIYLALKVKFDYDDNFFVTTQQFQEFRMNVLNNIIKYIEIEEIDDEGFDNKLNSFVDFNNSLDEYKARELINNFVHNNYEVSLIGQDIISLKKSTTSEDLKKLKIRTGNYADYYDELLIEVLNQSTKDISNLKILGATKKINDIKDLFDLEIKVEQLYETLNPNETDIVYYKSKIQDKLKQFYDNCSNIDLSNYLNIISSDLQDQFEYDIYLKAIFSIKPLAMYKINNYFMALKFMKQEDLPYSNDLSILANGIPRNYIDEYDDDESAIVTFEYKLTDDSEIAINKNYEVNYAFYNRYIEILDNYQRQNNHSLKLELIKNRLLYIIGSSSEYKKYKTSIKDFSIKHTAVNNIMKQPLNNINIESILFLLTYYDLTKDSTVKKFFKKYDKQHELDFSRLTRENKKTINIKRLQKKY